MPDRFHCYCNALAGPPFEVSQARLQKKLQEVGYSDVRVVRSEQLVRFDGLAVFNCGLDVANTPTDRFDKLIIEGKRE